MRAGPRFLCGGSIELSWELLGSNTLTGTADYIEVASFTAKKYLYVEFYAIGSGGTINCSMTFNGVTTQSYAIRENINGGSDSTNVNLSNTDNLTGTVTGNIFAYLNILNVADMQKLFISHGIENVAGSSNAPDRKELFGKFVETSNPITTIRATNGGGGDYSATSALVIYGTDGT